MGPTEPLKLTNHEIERGREKERRQFKREKATEKESERKIRMRI